MLYSTANKIEELLSLEARYGSLTEYTPAIDIIIEYLEQVNSCIASVLLPYPIDFPHTSWLVQRMYMTGK